MMEKRDETNPWYLKAKELERQLEMERLKTVNFLMRVTKIVLKKTRELVDEIDECYQEIDKVVKVEEA